MMQTSRQTMTERQLQDAVVSLARLLGWLVYHTYDSRRSEPGFPDLVLVRPPRLIFAELKAEQGTLTMAQANWIFLMRESGAEVHVWYPQDWHSGEVERVLRGQDVRASDAVRTIR